MKAPMFLRYLRSGEYVAPPDIRGIDENTERYTLLGVDEKGRWCKCEKQELSIGWINWPGENRPQKDGRISVEINPLVVSMNGVESAVGAEVSLETHEEIHCEVCNSVDHTYIDCPICLTEHACTDLYTGVFERFSKSGPFAIACEECDTVFHITGVEEGNAFVKASIDTRSSDDVLLRRSRGRLAMLREDKAPSALIDAEIRLLRKLENKVDC